MKRVVFISIILIMPFIGKAQWQTMVDKIFSCHSVRYEHGSYEMRDYIGYSYDGLPEDIDSYEYMRTMDFSSSIPTAIKFTDKYGFNWVDCGHGKNGYMFSDGYSNGQTTGNGLIIFIDEVYSGCKFYVGPFILGRPYGRGRYYSAEGRLLMNGEFYGQEDGTHPSFNYPSSSKRFEIQYLDNCVYIGETIGGTFAGYGLYVWNDGSAWFGAWRNGSRNGHGMELYNNCTMKTGCWYGNKYYKNKQ